MRAVALPLFSITRVTRTCRFTIYSRSLTIKTEDGTGVALMIDLNKEHPGGSSLILPYATTIIIIGPPDSWRMSTQPE